LSADDASFVADVFLLFKGHESPLQQQHDAAAVSALEADVKATVAIASPKTITAARAKIIRLFI
jgi:hypothetical protein